MNLIRIKEVSCILVLTGVLMTPLVLIGWSLHNDLANYQNLPPRAAKEYSTDTKAILQKLDQLEQKLEELSRAGESEAVPSINESITH